MAVIDIGPGATDRTGQGLSENTSFMMDNTANDTGTLDTVEVWAYENITGFRVGTFYLVSGTTYKCRDSATIGAVTAGSKQTFTGKSIGVTTGDYLGAYFATGQIEAGSGGTGRRYLVGEYIDPNDQMVDPISSSWQWSIYATGTTAAGGWANIKNIRAGTGVITATDLDSIWFGTSQVAVADVAEIPVGVAV